MMGRSLGICSLLVMGFIAAIPAAVAKQPAASAPSSTREVMVEGFRSARFGMNEAQLRRAILKDFNIQGAAVQRVEDPQERTSALLITVNDLLPDSGPALVAYMMGHKSRRLFRINVIWGHEIGSPATAEQVVAAANLLRDYLVAQGYRPDTLVLDQPLGEQNVLLFQGQDQRGRLTELVLGMVMDKPSKPDVPPVAIGASLRLSYVEKPLDPDIYRTPGGP